MSEQEKTKEQEDKEVTTQDQVTIPTLPEKEIDPQRKVLLLQELNALGTLMNATWHKPEYKGDYRGQNKQLVRSISCNIFGDRMLLMMQKRAEFIMRELGWFGE